VFETGVPETNSVAFTAEILCPAASVTPLRLVLPSPSVNVPTVQAGEYERSSDTWPEFVSEKVRVLVLLNPCPVGHERQSVPQLIPVVGTLETREVLRIFTLPPIVTDAMIAPATATISRGISMAAQRMRRIGNDLFSRI